MPNPKMETFTVDGVTYDVGISVVSYNGGTSVGNQTVNTICRLYQQTGITDLPEGVDVSTHICWLYTVGTSSNKHQVLFVPYTNGIYQHIYRGGSWSGWVGLDDTVTGAEKINVLCVGNSFNQDVMAYVPPILQELLPQTQFTFGICYTGSGGWSTHLDMYSNSTKYDYWNLWKPNASSWLRYSSSNDNGKTLVQALAYTDWDIILTQDTSGTVLNSTAIANSISNGRQLMRVIQGNLTKPAQFGLFAFVGRPYTSGSTNYTSAEMTQKIMDAVDEEMAKMGFMDFIPIASAIGSARTNATFAALGNAGDLLYDNHLQNGIGDLISSYVVALKILEWTGHGINGIYGSTFQPTDANVTAMNANGMTHGTAVGLTTANILAAQEIATLAVRNPTEIIDCSGIIVS